MDRVVARSDFSGRAGGGTSDSAGAQTSVGRVRARSENLPLCVRVPRPLVPSQLWVPEDRKRTSTLLNQLRGPRALLLVYGVREPNNTGANISQYVKIACRFCEIFFCDITNLCGELK